MKNPIDASFDVLTGRTEAHLRPCWSGHLVHRDALPALNALRERAASAGFELAVASSFRGYERQLQIWQEKVAGLRPVLDANEKALVVADLAPQQLLWALLRWSALPGTSRHHWGTDLDVFDARSLRDANCSLQLTAAECSGGGVLSEFHRWLGECLASEQVEGFYRPYAQDRGGVAVEPWHLSYAPVSNGFQRAFDYEIFQRLVDERRWPLWDCINENSQQIFERYIVLDSV